MIPSSYTPTSFGDTAGTQTVTFSFEGTDITVDVDYDVQAAATGFEVTGTLATQYQNRNVDTTGLSYTYNDVAVDPSDVTVSPSTWTAAGEGETITFTYDGNDVERTTDVLRTVASLPVTHTSSIPVDTVRSADLDEIFENVISSEFAARFLGDGWKFVIDVQGGTFAPVSLNAGDGVLWVQDKADYVLDQANGCDGTYVGTAMQLYGIDGMNLSFGPAPQASQGQEVATWTDFSINMPITGNGSATEDGEVCWVFAKAKANVADATTLKPSDVDLIAVWDVTYIAPDIPELTGLSVSGDFTDTQYTGAAPTKTGLTFTASYSNGTSETVSASDITVTPATWDASGNPDNLGEQTATFSYTEDGVTKTATKAVVIHRPSSGQVLDMNQEGWVFFDLTPEMKTLCANGQWGPAGLFQGNTANIGDPAFFVFTQNEYENDTPVTAATLGSWMPLYGLGSQGETFQQVGTPNESGFKPGYGVGAYNISDLNDCYVAVRTDGTATMSAGDETVYLVIGTLANALDGTSYKLSDMSTTGRTVYSAICRKSS